MRAIHVWAYHSELPDQGRVQHCQDARVGNGSRLLGQGQRYPDGNWSGQAGWHIALPFDDLADLAERLEQFDLPDYMGGGRIQRGELQTLSIDAHGSPGRFFCNGIRGRQLRSRTVSSFRGPLRRIGLLTASSRHTARDPVYGSGDTSWDASTIMLMGCNSARGADGDRLLTRLSYEWPHRLVVGFSVTIAHLRSIYRLHEGTAQECVRPFPLDSGRSDLHTDGVDEYLSTLDPTDATRIPFASPTSPNAKVAQDGAIIRRPADDDGTSTTRSRGLVGRPTRGRQPIQLGH